MGCNCGDNEYNIEIENNGDCEPTTPVYNITLGQIGVDGFSPKVNFINETSSSFQIQTIDVNGEEISGQVPLLSYVTDNYLLKDGSNADIPITINNNQLATSGVYRTSGGYFINSYGVKLESGTYKLDLPSVIFGSDGTNPVFINTTKDLFINKNNSSYKVYYHGDNGDNTNNEIATLGDIGNGTITITQGGVTKGTFTTNQSGNTTIALDAGGGGGSVTNPIVFTESSTETSSGVTTTTTGTLTLGLQTTGSIDPALKIHYKVEQSGEGGSSSYEWDEYLIDRTIPAVNGGLTAPVDSSTGRCVRSMSVNVDGSTLQINSSGKLEVKPNTFVQKSGDTMTGALTIATDEELGAITLKDTNLTKGTAPSANNSQSITFKDKDNKNVGMLTLVHVTNGGNYISMRAYEPQANSSNYADVMVGYNSGGTAYAQAPTPPANSNSTNIATTEWVRTYSSGKQDTLTAGDAIDITSNVIGVKIDGTSITLNADGELQSSGSVPSVIDGGNA